MNEIDVVGIGRAPLDILYLVDHFPIGDDLIRVQDASIQGGGPVPNALCALARLGVSTAIIDTVGSDWQGENIRKYLDTEKVDTRFLKTATGKRSTVSTILVHKSSAKRAIINYRGDTDEIELSKAELGLLSNTKILHISSSYNSAVLQAAKLVKSSGGKVSFDGGDGLFKEEDRSVISFTDYCITAIGYAQNYTHQNSIPKMLDAFLSEGVIVAGITCGSDGSWFKQANCEAFHTSAFIMPEVVDTTGCGDVFHGVFLYGMLMNFPVEKAALYASAAGAIVSTRLGGRTSAPTLTEIVELVDKN